MVEPPADSDDWLRLDTLLDAALAQPPSGRERFVEEACGGDALLRARLRWLLELALADDDLQPGAGLAGSVAREWLEDVASGEAGALAPGASLGPYQIRELLGEGAMGRVWRAYDPRLGREVAVKALSGHLRREPTALRRFEREARLLATINHPHVAAIHGFEVIGGEPYLLLELVEGETLEQRLRRGPLGWREALAVALPIAEALEEAHHRGVVHRDLKPANVKFTAQGRIKVLDFGLARALARVDHGARAGEGSSLPTTGPGTILGTAPYMSPEQAQGLPVDGRSDLWAFGCLFYEMLVGKRVFGEHNVADVLAAVARDEIDWSLLPDDLPAELRRLLGRCLCRDLRDRLQDAGDLRQELAELHARREPAEAPPPAGRTPRRWALAALLLAGLAGGAGLAALLGGLREPGRAGQAFPRLQVALTLPEGVELLDTYAAPFALSPDGSTLAFLGAQRGVTRLFVRRLDSLEAEPLPGTEGATQPFFSPDGQWLAFFAQRKLKKVALSGGAPITLLEVGISPRGGTWGADGSIVIAPSQTSGLARVPAEGGRLEELTRPDPGRGERSHRWPQLLPGGQALLFTVDHEGSTFDEAALEVLSLRSGQRRVLVEGGAQGRLVAGGYLAYGHAGRLFAVPFDPVRLMVGSSPRPVIEGLRYDDRNGASHFALAEDGTLVYVVGLPSVRERHLSWIDARGERARIPGLPRRFHDPRLDPAGERIAVRVGPPDEAEVWIQRTDGTLSPLTHDLRPWRPVWSRDGQHVVVGAEAGGRWRLLAVPVAGGPPQPLLERAQRLYPGDFSPDGRFLVFQVLSPERGWDVELLEVGAALDPQGRPAPLAATTANEANPRFSPDGRWLAYESDELDAEAGIYVLPFRHSGPRIKASQELGRWPVWGGAAQLFYWISITREMRRVSWTEEAGAFEVRGEQGAWPAGLHRAPGAHDFDPRTGRLLYLEELDPPSPPPPYRMTLFVGWAEEVRRRLAERD